MWVLPREEVVMIGMLGLTLARLMKHTISARKLSNLDNCAYCCSSHHFSSSYKYLVQYIVQIKVFFFFFLFLFLSCEIII